MTAPDKYFAAIRELNKAAYAAISASTGNPRPLLDIAWATDRLVDQYGGPTNPKETQP